MQVGAVGAIGGAMPRHPGLGLSGGQREHDWRRQHMRPDVDVALVIAAISRCLFVVQAHRDAGSIASMSRRRCACWSVGEQLSPRRGSSSRSRSWESPQVDAEGREDLLGTLCVAACGASAAPRDPVLAGLGLARPCAVCMGGYGDGRALRRSTGRPELSRTTRSGERQVLAVEGLVEACLHLLLGHRSYVRATGRQ